MHLGFLYGREKRSLLDIQWIIHSSQDQASLLDNKMPCMSNWWANGCPAEHSKLTAKSTIRFLSPFSSKHASLPGPLPVCANTYVAFESNCGARGEECLCCCSSAPRAGRFHSRRQQHRATTCTGWLLTTTWSLMLLSLKTHLIGLTALEGQSSTAAENCQIPSLLYLKLFLVISVGQRCSALLAVLGFLYEF